MDRTPVYVPDEDPAEAPGEGFTITSERAYVASTTVTCWKCRARIEVICIYCEDGTVDDEPLSEFTVIGPWAMDEALAGQLRPWPFFRSVEGEDYFANHCARCDALQDDLYLHSEPDHPFFRVTKRAPGSVKLTPLTGRVQLSGDESFEV